MSVRATGRLIGDIVIVTELAKSPQMVVKGIDEENKLVNTVWFSNDNAYQEGVFPASALDRFEEKKPVAKKKTTKK